jgi:hypothetical protein
MGNHGAQTTPTYVATSLAARFYRVDDDLTTSHTENRLGIDQQHGYRPWSARREDVE